MKSKKPDFISIAPHKTGTTWLHVMLNPHHQVWLPPKKELWVLNLLETPYLERLNDLYTGTGMPGDMRRRFLEDLRIPGNRSLLKSRTYFRLFWWFKYLLQPYNLATYAALFPGNPKLITGDITPNYYYIKEAVIRQLHEYHPDLKIILILRNPVDRAWSYAKMDIREQLKKKVTEFSDVELMEYFDKNYNWWWKSHPYYKKLKLWQRYFNNIHIDYFDHLQENPTEFFNQICNFLKIDRVVNPSALSRHVNRSPAILLSDEVKQYLNSQYIEETRMLSQIQKSPYIEKWISDMEDQHS